MRKICFNKYTSTNTSSMWTSSVFFMCGASADFRPKHNIDKPTNKRTQTTKRAGKSQGYSSVKVQKESKILLTGLTT